MKFLGQYMQIKKRNMKIAWKKAKMSKRSEEHTSELQSQR